MIQVKYQEGTFFVKGTLDLAYAGKYENASFFLSEEDENVSITISASLEEILESMEEEDDKEEYGLEWAFLNEYTDNTDGDSIAKAIESYFNLQEQKVAENSILFNNRMISELYSTLVNTELEFWSEAAELTVEEKIKHCDPEEISEFVYNDAVQLFEETIDAVLETMELGTIPADLSVMMEQILGSFHLKQFFEGIKPYVLSLDGSRMIFQCDDSTNGNVIFCGAYAEVKHDLTFDDWHNQ